MGGIERSAKSTAFLLFDESNVEVASKIELKKKFFSICGCQLVMRKDAVLGRSLP